LMVAILITWQTGKGKKPVRRTTDQPSNRPTSNRRNRR
jgi:hypothetical protein